VEALDAQAAVPAPQLSALPGSAEASVPVIPNPTELMSQCLMEKNNTVVAVFYDEPQRLEHYQSHGMCCLVDYTPEQLEAEGAASSNTKEPSPVTSTESIEAEASGAAAQPPSAASNASASSVPAATGASSNATAPSSVPAATSMLPATHSTAVSSTQGLSRLESIFVRITKKSTSSARHNADLRPGV
jgi:hypothetical protein